MLQKRAVRFIDNLPYDANLQPAFSKQKILTIQNIFTLKLTCDIYHDITLNPQTFTETLFRQPVPYSLRNHLFHTPSIRTNYGAGKQCYLKPSLLNTNTDITLLL